MRKGLGQEQAFVLGLKVCLGEAEGVSHREVPAEQVPTGYQDNAYSPSWF